MNVPRILSFLSHNLAQLSALPERIDGLKRTRDMEKKIAQLQARIALLEDSVKGMEELVIIVLEAKETKRNPLSWSQPKEMPQA